MWIEKLPSGKYRYCERFKNPNTGKTKKISLVSSKKNDKANMSVKLYEAYTASLGALSASSDTTFSQVIDEWYAIYQQKAQGQSAITRSSHVRLIKRDLGDSLASKLNAVILNKYLLKLTNQGKAYRTMEGYKDTLSLIVKFGYKYGHFETDFSRDLSIEKVNQSTDNTFKYLEHDELRALLAFLEEKRPEFARLVRLQVLTGMRIGELTALDYKKHIDFENRTITIERTYNVTLNAFGPPKTGKTRIIDFNADAYQVLKEQISFTMAKKIRYNKIDSNNNLLFMTTGGRPFPPKDINKLLKECPGIDKKITTHYMRHTFVTIAIENNIPFISIAEHVGHTNTRMIDEVYKHHSNKMKRVLKDKIENMAYNF